MNTEEIMIVIPSLNPDEKLIKTIDGIIKKGFKNIVVVDDGSNIKHLEPFEYAKEKGCKVLYHELNRGKGRALKTAFTYCMVKGVKGVVTVDGDGQHSPEDIYKCAEAMMEREEVIFGCRDFSEEQVPFKSRYGNRITKLALRLMCGIKLSDTQTGLRAIPAKYLPRISIYEGERFEYETNMIIEMKSDNIPFSEVKIETIYLDENVSLHFNPFKDSWRIYKCIFKYALSSIASSLIDLLVFYLMLYFFEAKGIESSYNIIRATVFARVISSLFNYLSNQIMVFRTKSESSFLRYYALCIVQMMTSAFLVQFATSPFSFSKTLKTMIKLIVDTFLFFVSYKIQKEWVFKETIPSKSITGQQGEGMKSMFSSYMKHSDELVREDILDKLGRDVDNEEE